ncbi:hypothetical protein BTO20_02515 [Mycobacterium dioxanotrophicus]|uniref:Pentapeptide repeat-containing protein n=1 Tax=Mycobacterium dioxanotrophicus TaxID=482462 RepID=A0A1Y0BXI2_9MYCO|nr:hypothetical protein BTO20_02515 [Mycobacterium dioxanotrophicus]
MRSGSPLPATSPRCSSNVSASPRRSTAATPEARAIGNSQEAQVPIDVLCTYLRTHHLSGPSPERYDYNTPPPDSPVRDTIVKIFVNHLQPAELWGTRRPRVSGTYALPNPCPTPGDWSHRDFDLDGAHLHNSDFGGVYFAGIASFRSTHFSGTTLFRWAHFTRETRFDDSEFTGDASFDGAQFAGNT